jgi:hypothetical protein
MTIVSGPTIYVPATPEAEAFYGQCLKLLADLGIPFLVGGMFAVNAYTGLRRKVKDLDVFCKPGDYPRIITCFRDLGYETEIEDERWIAKIKKDDFFVDVIFNSTSALVPVTDQWFTETSTACLYDREVPLLAPTELVWSKVFVQTRLRHDAADVAHVILKQCERIDWRRLLSYMDQYWEVLLIHVLNFRFIYPTERQRIPQWLLDELTARLREQAELPVPRIKICRGRLFSRQDYLVDIDEWGFADLLGEGEHTKSGE